MILEPEIREDIQRGFSELEKDGKLLSQQKLNECYSRFRERFGPDVLMGMDGEQLLDTMHAPVSYTHLTLPTNREV